MKFLQGTEERADLSCWPMTAARAFRRPPRLLARAFLAVAEVSGAAAHGRIMLAAPVSAPPTGCRGTDAFQAPSGSSIPIDYQIEE
jgi:hypothetical protein